MHALQLSSEYLGWRCDVIPPRNAAKVEAITNADAAYEAQLIGPSDTGAVHLRNILVLTCVQTWCRRRYRIISNALPEHCCIDRLEVCHILYTKSMAWCITAVFPVR